MKQVSSSIKHAVQRTPTRVAHQVARAGRNGQKLATEVFAATKKFARSFAATAVQPTAVTEVPEKRVQFAKQLVTVLNPATKAPKDSSRKSTYRQRPNAQAKGTPETSTHPLETEQLISDLDDVLDELATKTLVSDLDELLEQLDDQRVKAARQQALQEVDSLLDQLDQEIDLKKQSLQEVDRLLDQLDQEIALKDPRPAAPRIGAAKAAAADAAQAQLDESTAELTALLDGLKQDVVQRHTAHIGSENEMRAAEKVSASAKPIGAHAVTLHAEEMAAAPL